jgi:hypothetical protein
MMGEIIPLTGLAPLEPSFGEARRGGRGTARP